MSRWEGRCPRCETWASLVEVIPSSLGSPGALGNSSITPGNSSVTPAKAGAASLSDLMEAATAHPARMAVRDMPELMTVLGGGIVPGSVILLGGEPGIGKSTLLLQLASAVGSGGASIVYVAGEESPEQIALRAARLALTGEGVTMVTETNMDALLADLNNGPPNLLLVDSIQTLRTEGVIVGRQRRAGARVRSKARRMGPPSRCLRHNVRPCHKGRRDRRTPCS